MGRGRFVSSVFNLAEASEKTCLSWHVDAAGFLGLLDIFPGLFVLVSVRLRPPEPIMCLDCQGSELAQGYAAVAMLRWKTSLLLSCRPEGCWDAEPTALRLDRFMEEDHV